MSEAGIGYCQLMTNSQTDAKLIEDFTKDQLTETVERLLDADIDVVLSTWPQPSPESIAEVAWYLRLASSLGCVGVEFDCEGGNWHSRQVNRYDSLDEATDAMCHEVLRGKTGGLEINATTHHGRTKSRYAKPSSARRLATSTIRKRMASQP